MGIFEVEEVHYYYDRGSDRNIKAQHNDITHMERIDLLDFTAEQFNPPLNLEPIPGGY